MIERLGFTGTRQGMTLEQNRTYRRLLREHRPAELGHGLCDGADLQAHWSARKLYGKLGLKLKIHGFPMTQGLWSGDWMQKQRAARDCDHLYPEAPPLERNQLIVDWCTALVATPREEHEVIRSGTWATVRYARKRPIPILIIQPDGSVQ